MALFPFIVEDEIIHIIELTSDFLGELRPCLVKSDKPRCKNINVNNINVNNINVNNINVNNINVNNINVININVNNINVNNINVNKQQMQQNIYQGAIH